MSKIGEISGAIISVRANDRRHPVPHVHVWYQGYKASLQIADAGVLAISNHFPPAILADVREWLLDNRDVAAEQWAEYHDDP